jgi:hypothetical protein
MEMPSATISGGARVSIRRPSRQPGYRAQRGRLAGAVGTNQGDDLAALQLDRDTT